MPDSFRRARLACMRLRGKLLHKYRRTLPRQHSRVGKIVLCGIKPAVSYGDKVLGMSDHELRKARRLMLSFQAPRHRGCSLTARLVINGDPMWDSAVAPALQWSNALWKAATAPGATHMNMKQLCRIWRDVSSGQPCTKAHSASREYRPRSRDTQNGRAQRADLGQRAEFRHLSGDHLHNHHDLSLGET